MKFHAFNSKAGNPMADTLRAMGFPEMVINNVRDMSIQQNLAEATLCTVTFYMFDPQSGHIKMGPPAVDVTTFNDTVLVHDTGLKVEHDSNVRSVDPAGAEEDYYKKKLVRNGAILNRKARKNREKRKGMRKDG